MTTKIDPNKESGFAIPRPYPWQAKFLAKDKKKRPKLSVLCVGRRAGKTQCAVLWALSAPGGLLEGGHVCWLGPTASIIAEAKSWVRRWIAPIIVGASPGDRGYELSNGGRIDFESAGPNAKIPVRSRGYDLCVCDEAARIEGLETIVNAAVKPALSLSSGRILMISTPRGMNPFRDYYIEAQRDGIAFSAPSTVNPHLKASEFEKLRRSTPPLVFEEEYLARFVQMGGALLKKEHIRYVEKAPRLESMSISFGIDLALRTDGKSDYSAIVVCGKASGDDRTYVLHCDRWRATWPETVAKLANYNRAWSPEICGIENYLFQELTVRDLLKVGLPMHALKSSKGKEERFLLLTTPYALGLVHHVESLRGSEFEMELTAFPESAHDDWCDALVYGYAVLNRELRVAMSEQDGGYLNWGHRLKAEIDTRLFHGDGSYDVIEEQPDGEAEMVHRNPDGSEFDDTWHHELVGDECVIFEGGKEISRHPRWHLPILLEARRLAYREKYNGRKVN